MIAGHPSRRRMSGVILWVLCVLGGPVLVLGELEKSPPKEPPVIEIDLLQLIESRDLLSMTARYEGPIWTITPEPGRRLIQIPIEITPSEEEFGFSSSVVRVNGGRFVAWLLVDPTVEAVNDKNKSEQARLMLRPWVTRGFTLRPDGTIEWKLDRFIPSGKVVRSKRRYALKVDINEMNRLSPGDPPRVVRANNEAQEQYIRRRRFEEANYRRAALDFRELRQEVMDLPSRFEDPLPRPVWALFELSQTATYLKVVGATPGPWRIGIDQFVAVRDLATKKVPIEDEQTGGLSHQAMDAVDLMAGLVKDDPHPYNLRAVSYAISRAGLVSYAAPGDQLFMLLQSVIASPDAEARRVVLKELITTIPPTPASRQLLAATTKEAIDPQLQLIRLKGLLQSDTANRAQVRETLASANRMLTDPVGPPPGEVLRALLAAAQQNDDAVGALAQGVRFAAMQEPRRSQAVVFVVSHADSEALAMRWLDRSLLGSPDPNMALTTLRTLKSIDPGDQVLRPVMKGALAAVFGPGDSESAPVGRAAIELANPIPLGGGDHNLFRMLRHEGIETRSLAWEVLKHFTMGDAAAMGVTDDQRRQAYTLLLDITLGQSPTPSQVVEFLARQTDEPVATDALVQVALLADSAVSAQATRALLGSGRPVNRAVMALPFGDRHGFGMRVYESRMGKAPLAVGLLRERDEDSAVTKWFGTQVAAGNLPDPADWYDAFGGEERLLSLLQSNDQEMVAAAVATLLASAGVGESEVPALMARFQGINDPTAVTLEAEWRHVRKRYFAEKIRGASGQYHLEIVVHKPEHEGLQFGLNGDNGEKVFRLGVVNLQSDGRTVRLENQPVTLSISESEPAIRFDHPREFERLDERLSEFRLDTVQTPLVLSETDDGRWVAQTTLESGHVVEVSLRPAR